MSQSESYQVAIIGSGASDRPIHLGERPIPGYGLRDRLTKKSKFSEYSEHSTANGSTGNSRLTCDLDDGYQPNSLIPETDTDFAGGLNQLMIRIDESQTMNSVSDWRI